MKGWLNKLLVKCVHTYATTFFNILFLDLDGYLLDGIDLNVYFISVYNNVQGQPERLNLNASIGIINIFTIHNYFIMKGTITTYSLIIVCVSFINVRYQYLCAAPYPDMSSFTDTPLGTSAVMLKNHSWDFLRIRALNSLLVCDFSSLSTRLLGNTKNHQATSENVFVFLLLSKTHSASWATVDWGIVFRISVVLFSLLSDLNVPCKLYVDWSVDRHLFIHCSTEISAMFG